MSGCRRARQSGPSRRGTGTSRSRRRGPGSNSRTPARPGPANLTGTGSGPPYEDVGDCRGHRESDDRRSRAHHGLKPLVTSVSSARGVLGRDRILRALERGLQRVPGEGRALHAHRELGDAGEARELAEAVAVLGEASPVTSSWKRSKSAVASARASPSRPRSSATPRPSRSRSRALERDVLDRVRRRSSGRA